MVEALAEGRFDAGPRHRAGPGRRDRDADRPDHGAAGAGQLAHRARRLRRPALRPPRSWRRRADMALSIFYRQCGACSRRAPPATSRSPASASSATAIGRWGRGVDTSRFDPRDPDAIAECASSAAPGLRDQGALRRAADQGEGRRAAGRLLPRGRTRPIRGCTCCSAAAGPRRDSCASGSATAPRSSAGSRATSCPRAYASADIFLFCQPDRHLRPGAGRGRRQRAAGRRRRRGRPGLDRRRRRDRAALRAPTRSMLAAALLQLADAPAWRAKLGRQGLAAARARTWEAAMAQLADGYARRAASRSPRRTGIDPRPERLDRRSSHPGMSEDAIETARGTRSTDADGGRGGARRAAARPTATARSTSTDTSLYFNRELSWMDFNDRVLQLAEDPTRAAARARSSSARSTRTTSTSSSWSGSPACTTRSRPSSTRAAPTGSRRAR